ncbi:uncharacterized protein [Dermacentor andersoni]
MSLLRWETVFFLSDEVFHMARAASDLGVVIDACVSGIPSMAALVRVMASLFLVAFHALYLGPRSSLASDAAIFFGDMQFHFFHMLLCTWQLVHYLWTTQKRNARSYVYHWTSFLFHTGIVWFYTSGITVSIRVQLVNGPGANDAPVPAPPPMPPVPNPEAVAMAIAAARAADAAAARLALQPRGSNASSLRGSPRFGSSSPRRSSSRSSSRRDSMLAQETLVTSLPGPARLPEDSAVGEVLGSVTQTLSGASMSCSSKTALVPYVERQPTPREDNAPRQPEQSLGVQQPRTWNPSGADTCSPLVDVQSAATSSEPAANEARCTPTPGAAESPTRGDTEGRVQSSASGNSPDVARGSVEGAFTGPADANGRLQSPTTEEDFKSASPAAARDSAATVTYGSSELVVDLAQSSVECPVLGNKAGTSPTSAQVSSLPGPSCSRVQDMAKKSKSSREQSAKHSRATSRKSSSYSATPFKSPTEIQGSSSLGSPSGHAQATEEPQSPPKELKSTKQSPTTSRKPSGSDNPFKSSLNSPAGSPSGRVQEPVERPDHCWEQSAKQSPAASLKPSAPATPSESPE